jgi:hypothetical protein
VTYQIEQFKEQTGLCDPRVKYIKKGKLHPIQATKGLGGSRGLALLFQDLGAWWGWVVSTTPWPLSTPGKDPVPIIQEAGWAPGPV